MERGDWKRFLEYRKREVERLKGIDCLELCHLEEAYKNDVAEPEVEENWDAFQTCVDDRWPQPGPPAPPDVVAQYNSAESAATEEYQKTLGELEAFLTGPGPTFSEKQRSEYVQPLCDLFQDWIGPHIAKIKAELAHVSAERKLEIYAERWTPYYSLARCYSQPLPPYWGPGLSTSYRWVIPLYQFCIFEWFNHVVAPIRPVLRAETDSLLERCLQTEGHETKLILVFQAVLNSDEAIGHEINRPVKIAPNAPFTSLEEIAHHVESSREIAKRIFPRWYFQDIRTMNSLTFVKASRCEAGRGPWGVTQADFMDFLERNDRSTLAAIYIILQELEAEVEPGPFYATLGMFLHSRCLQMLEDVRSRFSAAFHPRVFIASVAKVMKLGNGLVQEAFKSDKGFQEAMDKSILDGVNRNCFCISDTDAPRLLSEAVEVLFSPEIPKTEAAAELEDPESMALLFAALKNKEAFVTNYISSLVHSIVNSESHTPNDKVQAFNEALLKSPCPELAPLVEILSKLNEAESFQRKYLAQVLNPQATFASSFLTLSQSVSWSLPPTPPAFDFIPPQEVTEANAVFKGFYGIQHEARKLSWAWHACHGEVKMNWTASSAVLRVTAYQMAVLLMFNRGDTLHFNRIQEGTGLPRRMLMVLLLGFVDAGILRGKGEKFSVNEVFKGEGVIDLRESLDWKRYEDPAAMVRVMKSLRKATIWEFSGHVAEQMGMYFPPDPELITHCVELLVKRDYLEWTKDACILYVP
ncbi:Cullin family-domain-containing protein [Immersiella caudata]|uniref:Cullin family-domain-containing protein n=1 Tax=Immersiella caudata TaxID=314043 RepID=A0AA39XCD9_9PEZI|nr:Cullin family-domain-containing protein [Immersiella caudata]